MLLYAMLAVCGALAAGMVYRYDLHDREPWYVALLAIALGAAGMYLAGRAQVGVLAGMGTAAAAHWSLSISLAAGISEEVAKLAVVVSVAWTLPRAFNDPLDGIVYGSLAGVGAALEESVALLGSVSAWQMLPAPEVVRIAGHLVMGGIGGFGMGMVRPERRPLWGVGLPAALGGAVAIHVLWDLVAFSGTGRSGWQSLAAVGLMGAGLAVYWRMVVTGERWSRAWFERNEKPRGDGPAASVGTRYTSG
jgi:RsiW-degrading membrane proteinase PrsW (M82 family)